MLFTVPSTTAGFKNHYKKSAKYIMNSILQNRKLRAENQTKVYVQKPRPKMPLKNSDLQTVLRHLGALPTESSLVSFNVSRGEKMP
jgi:hypothetical protein